MWREAYLKDIRRTYRKYRELAESAITQVDDSDLHRSLDDEDNSIAIVMQHTWQETSGHDSADSWSPTAKNRIAIATPSSKRTPASIVRRCWQPGMQPGTSSSASSTR